MGAKEIKEGGDIVIAQDESTSVVWRMPKSVVEAGLADIILHLHRIGPYLNRLISHLLSLRLMRVE